MNFTISKFLHSINEYYSEKILFICTFSKSQEDHSIV